MQSPERDCAGLSSSLACLPHHKDKIVRLMKESRALSVPVYAIGHISETRETRGPFTSLERTRRGIRSWVKRRGAGRGAISRDDWKMSGAREHLPGER